MMSFLGIALGFVFLLFLIYTVLIKRRKPSGSTPMEINEAELAAAEKALAESEAKDWVVLKRLHGPAYTYNTLTDIVARLQSEGVEATFDTVSSSSAEMGVTNYMLKVVRGSEEKAQRIFDEM